MIIFAPTHGRALSKKKGIGQVTASSHWRRIYHAEYSWLKTYAPFWGEERRGIVVELGKLI